MNTKIEIPKTIPLLPIKETTPFPQMLLSLYIGRSHSKKSIEEALKTNRIVFLTSQKEADTSIITEHSIYNVGVIAIVMRMRKLKNGRMKILVQGLSRGTIEKYNLDNTLQTVEVKKVEERALKEDQKVLSLVSQVKTALKKLSSFENQTFSHDLVNILNKVIEPSRLADLIAGNLNLKMTDTQKILQSFDPFERLSLILTLIQKEIEILHMQNRIKNMVHSQIENRNKNEHKPSFQNLNRHSRELDARTEEIQELSQKIKEAGMPQEIEKEVRKHLNRLEKMHPESSEASIIRNYLDWCSCLPWNKHTKDHIELNQAQEILDEDHFGLDEVKDRILEFLAVKQLTPQQKNTPILCFVGPPGVGKTSLGKSIARSTGRKYTRIALGGIKDEAEIRGHRKTYVGAMPGKIIQALKHAQSKNPIIVLDELDKLGSDYRGDPAAAMLEVLDPEQNHSFKDHFLNVNFDLSHALFIATANVFEDIPAALRDRMETIQLPGYTPKEKLKIAEKYIIKKSMETHGVTEENLLFTEKGVEFLIEHYTKEAGLRNLKREINSICRKVAKKIVLGEKVTQVANPDTIKSFLGCPRFLNEEKLSENKIGVVTGLAWTQYGGKVLYVESIKIPGKEGHKITGKLGDVMKESAQAAFSFVRSYCDQIGIQSSWFKSNEIHTHLPAGAIPKDGPSAGVTLATSLISLITQTPVRKDVAMTGEIGLQGQVLPIGGVKEKAIAALNHGITTVILPKKNQADLENLDNKDSTLQELNEKIKFIFVETLDEVFQHALISSERKEKTVTQIPSVA